MISSWSFGPFQVTVAGVSGVTGQRVQSHAVGVFKPGGESVIVPVQRGQGTTVRGWEPRPYAVTLTTAQVQLCALCRLRVRVWTYVVYTWSLVCCFSLSFIALWMYVLVAPCSRVPGTVFSSCGPSCPRSCEDLTVSVTLSMALVVCTLSHLVWDEEHWGW